MAPAQTAPAQFKQPSRKGKKAWRKNVDLTDIYAGLESVRDELIQGGVVAEKTSDQLFTVDTAGDGKSKPTNPNKVPLKELKADQILGHRSAIAAVDSRKRSGVTDGVLEPRAKRQRTPYVSPRDLERLRQLGRSSRSTFTNGDVDAPTRDPWAVDAVPAEQQLSYAEGPQIAKEPSTLKRAAESLLASKKAAPAVAKPRAGTSYNPTFQDWDTMLTAAGEDEVKAELKRQEEERWEAARQARIAATRDEQEIEEGEESVWEGLESEYETEGGGKFGQPKKLKIKTRADRNRIERRKAAEREAKARAKEQQKREQMGRAEKIAEDVGRTEVAGKALATQTDASDDTEGDERLRRRLKKFTLPSQHLELVLPHELQDSLRRLRPEGNLLRDRFRSAMVRGRVEPRRPVAQHKKPRRFETERWSYKDFELPVVK